MYGESGTDGIALDLRNEFEFLLQVHGTVMYVT